ncbi:hypothetical protein BUQ74_04810 [Leptospira weilii serovar Heyan]|nr:hypothetical protein BUQ74_04810 [Leptospira weilii serovar Heyan]
MVPSGLENRKYLPQNKKNREKERKWKKRSSSRQSREPSITLRYLRQPHFLARSASQRNDQYSYLTNNTKDMLKEQRIKHNEAQIKKFIRKLKHVFTLRSL